MNRIGIRLAAGIAVWGIVAGPDTARPLRADGAASQSASKGNGFEAARTSTLVDVALPGDARRVTSDAEIAKFAGPLANIARKQQCRTEATEVLIWPNAGNVQTSLPRLLQKAGYNYAPRAPVTDPDTGTLTVFLCMRPGEKEGLLGIWFAQGDQRLLAWAKLLPAGQDGNGAAAGDAAPAAPVKADREPAADDAPASALVVDIPASASHINVMGKAKPYLPTMPTLALKPGYVRGYVYDTKGHPLKGALIGVRSTAVGGFDTGASVKTDAKGYYEMKPPWGVGEFYCAGYPTDYGDGIAAFGLCPADGEHDEFATATGVAKNWVLVPYGIADRAGVQDQPQYSGNYYGGAFVLSYDVDSEHAYPQTKGLPAGATVEILLTPDGPLLDGSRSRPILLRRKVGDSFAITLYVTNIPIGQYRISAKLAGGEKLHMKEVGPYTNAAFGLDPKDATGDAALLLKSYGADPNSATAGHGSWKEMQIVLERI